jgi:hypothetical protein
LLKTIQLAEEANSNEKQPDYFYDSSLTEEEIEKAKNEKKQSASIKQVETTNKTDPNWFKESNKPVEDPFANFLDFFSSKSQNNTDKQPMPPMMKEMMLKYQAEQMEKWRQSRKSTSNLNHQMLSIITLSAFFGTGIVVSLIIAFTRGIQFKKLKQSIKNTYGNKKKKSIYKSVEELDNQINA